jgi:hypothetical protein
LRASSRELARPPAGGWRHAGPDFAGTATTARVRRSAAGLANYYDSRSMIIRLVFVGGTIIGFGSFI